MRKNILRVGLVSLFAAGLASCGGEEAQPLTASNAGTVLGQFSQQVLGKLPTGNDGSTVSLPFAGATVAAKPGGVATMATDCETVSPAVTVDADSDHIAATKTSTFDCTDMASGGSTYTRKGSYTVKDSDETVAGLAGGMRTDFDLTSYNSVDSSGNKSEASHKGFWEYKANGTNAFTSTSEYTGHVKYVPTSGDYNYDYDFGYTWSYSMQPAGAGDPWTTQNNQSFRGDLNMNGTFTKEDANGNHTQFTGAFRISYYSKNLVYDNSCTHSPKYSSGSIFIEDSNGTSIEIRYLCSSAELYVNGVKSDWWTP